MKIYNNLTIALTTKESEAVYTVLGLVTDISFELSNNNVFKGDRVWTESAVDDVHSFLEDLYFGCESE